MCITEPQVTQLGAVRSIDYCGRCIFKFFNSAVMRDSWEVTLLSNESTFDSRVSILLLCTVEAPNSCTPLVSLTLYCWWFRAIFLINSYASLAVRSINEPPEAASNMPLSWPLVHHRNTALVAHQEFDGGGIWTKDLGNDSSSHIETHRTLV